MMNIEPEVLEVIHKYPINTRLRKLRLFSELTQNELAKILKCSKSSIYGWERGTSTPNQGMLMKIIKFYNVPFDYFEEDDD